MIGLAMQPVERSDIAVTSLVRHHDAIASGSKQSP